MEIMAILMLKPQNPSRFRGHCDPYRDTHRDSRFIHRRVYQLTVFQSANSLQSGARILKAGPRKRRLREGTKIASHCRTQGLVNSRSRTKSGNFESLFHQKYEARKFESGFIRFFLYNFLSELPLEIECVTT